MFMKGKISRENQVLTSYSGNSRDKAYNEKCKKWQLKDVILKHGDK